MSTILFLLLSELSLSAFSMHGIITELRSSENDALYEDVLSFYNAPFFMQTVTYTPGGITIVFPDNLFPVKPCVNISLVLLNNQKPHGAYTYQLYDLTKNQVSMVIFDSTGKELMTDNVIEINFVSFCKDTTETSIITF